MEEILDQHELWLMSDKTLGKKCKILHRVFSEMKFENRILKEVDLHSSIFKNSDFNNCDFSNSKISYTDFHNSNFRDADFSNSNIERIKFRDCNLEGANFEGVDIHSIDFSGSIMKGVNINLDDIPYVENLIQKVAERALQPNSLEMESWETCRTIRCIGGWACYFAGIKEDLEYDFGAIASLLFLKSGLTTIPDFYSTNEEAIEYLKKFI